MQKEELSIEFLAQKLEESQAEFTLFHSNKAIFEGDLSQYFDILQGGELTPEQLKNIYIAMITIADCDDVSFAIAKNQRIYGVASAQTPKESFELALEQEPIESYKAVIAANCIIDEESAAEIRKLTFDVIVASDYDVEAIELLSVQKEAKIVVFKQMPKEKVVVTELFGGKLYEQIG